jgi:hypothetical protein
VARREHETVAVEPVGVCGTVLEVSVPENERQRRTAQRHSWVTGVRLLDRVYGEAADGVDAELVEGGT